MRTSWPRLRNALVNPATASPSPPLWARGEHSEEMKRSRFPEELDEEEVGLLSPPRVALSFFGCGTGFAVRSSCTAALPCALGATSGTTVFWEPERDEVFAGSIFNGAKLGFASGFFATLDAGTEILFVVGTLVGTAGALILAATDAGVVLGAAVGFEDEVNVCVIFGKGESGAVTDAGGFGVDAGAVGAFGTADLVPGLVSITGVAFTEDTGTVGAADFAGGFAGPEVLGVSLADFFPAEKVLIAFVGAVADGFLRGEEAFDFGFLPAGNLAMRGTINPLSNTVKLHAHFLAESSVVVPESKM